MLSPLGINVGLGDQCGAAHILLVLVLFRHSCMVWVGLILKIACDAVIQLLVVRLHGVLGDLGLLEFVGLPDELLELLVDLLPAVDELVGVHELVEEADEVSIGEAEVGEVIVSVPVEHLVEVLLGVAEELELGEEDLVDLDVGVELSPDDLDDLVGEDLLRVLVAGLEDNEVVKDLEHVGHGVEVLLELESLDEVLDGALHLEFEFLDCVCDAVVEGFELQLLVFQVGHVLVEELDVFGRGGLHNVHEVVVVEDPAFQVLALEFLQEGHGLVFDPDSEDFRRVVVVDNF